MKPIIKPSLAIALTVGVIALATATSCASDNRKRAEESAITNSTTAVSNSIANPPSPGFVLNNAPLSTVLRLYAEFTGRTVLRPASLPGARLSLVASTTKAADGAAAIEKALRSQGIATVADGDKFVMVIPEAQLSSVRPRSSQLKVATPTELIPAGTINFTGANSEAVARIYAELTGRKFDAATSARLNGMVNLQTQTPLSKTECLYALDTLFEWQGIKMVPVGEDLIKAVPIPGK